MTDGVIDLERLDADSGVTIRSDGASYSIGDFVAPAGDFNRDGFNDFIVSGYDHTSEYIGIGEIGAIYVVFGHANFTSMNLSAIDGTNGVRFIGESNLGSRLIRFGAQEEGDLFGASASSAGDFNHDGIDDIAIGAPEADPNGQENAGVVFIVYGHEGPWVSPWNVSLLLNPSTGFVIHGASAGDRSGSQVVSIGDFNNDNIDDLGISAPGAAVNGHRSVGIIHVVFGAPNVSRVMNLSSITAGGGVIIHNERTSYLPIRQRLSPAGDINGDGSMDLAVAATTSSDNSAFIVFGGEDVPTVLNVSALNGTYGATISSAGDGHTLHRWTVAGGGDVNGDGFDDLLVNDISTGLHRCVVFGRFLWPPVVNFSSIGTADNDGVLLAESALRGSMYGLSLGGDFNNDGIADFMIGFRDERIACVANVGATAVAYGALGPSGQVDVASLNGSNGFRLYESRAQHELGASVANLGDINGDGIDDMAFSAPGSYAIRAANYSGEVYVMFGRTGGITQVSAAPTPAPTLLPTSFLESRSILPINSLDGSNGFRLSGVRNERVGLRLSGIGDFNGDGFDDAVVGTETESRDPGNVHILLGHAGGNPVSSDLTNMTAGNRIVITGISARGQSVAGAGDVNRDGYTDVMVSSFVGLDRSRVYIIFGNGNTSRTVNLSSFSLSDGFILEDGFASGLFGQGLSSAGDVDGDGNSDILVGDNAFARSAGATYLVYGGSNFSAVSGVQYLDGSNGTVFLGVEQNLDSGMSVSGAGDINNDTYTDIIIGTSANVSFIVLGGPRTFGPAVNLSSLNGFNGFRVEGGFRPLSAIGDINGDGVDDFAVSGAPESGACHIFFGQPGLGTANVDVSLLTGSNGFSVLTGGDGISSISGAGDVNGDGIDDMIIGLSGVDSAGLENVGASYFIFGRITWQQYLNLSSINGSNGIVIEGRAAGDYTGATVSGIGDFNGDGHPDVMLGAPGADPHGECLGGELSILFGGRGLLASPLTTSPNSLSPVSAPTISPTAVALFNLTTTLLASVAPSATPPGITSSPTGARLAGSPTPPESGGENTGGGSGSAEMDPTLLIIILMLVLLAFLGVGLLFRRFRKSSAKTSLDAALGVVTMVPMMLNPVHRANADAPDFHRSPAQQDAPGPYSLFLDPTEGPAQGGAGMYRLFGPNGLVAGGGSRTGVSNNGNQLGPDTGSSRMLDEDCYVLRKPMGDLTNGRPGTTDIDGYEIPSSAPGVSADGRPGDVGRDGYVIPVAGDAAGAERNGPPRQDGHAGVSVFGRDRRRAQQGDLDYEVSPYAVHVPNGSIA